MKLGTLLETEFRPLRLARCKPYCHKQYVYAIQKFGNFLGRPPELRDLDDHLVSDLLGWLLSGESGFTYAPRSVNNCRKYLVSLWNFANRKGFVRIGPDVQAIREPEDAPRAFTIEQIQQLVRHCRNAPNPLFWEAIVLAIYSTGERVGAARQWRRDWIDLETGTISTPGRARKNGRAKAYHLKPSAHAAMARLMRSHRRAEVFGGFYETAPLYCRFTKILAEADLPSGYKYKFHALRRSHASYIAKKLGITGAQESLDHTTTIHTRRYLDPRIVGVRRFDNDLPDV